MDLQPDDFRYILIVDDQELEITQSPIGWDENTLRWGRSDLYHGVIRSFSLPVKFVLDAAWLIRKKFYTKGIEGKAKLRIELLNRSNWQYFELYTGDVDFSTISDTLIGIECTLMDAEIVSLIKAYEGIVYEFSINNNPDKIEVLLPGIDRETKAEMFGTGLNVFNQSFIFPLNILISSLGDFATLQDLVYSPVSTSPDFSSDSRYFVEFNEFGELKVHVTGVVDILPGNNFQFIIIGNDNSIYHTEQSPASTGTPYKWNFDFTATIQGGGVLLVNKFFIYIKDIAGSAWIQLNDINIKITRFFIEDPSLLYCYRPFDLFRDFMRKITGINDLAVQSNLLQGYFKRLAITSGNAIRQLETATIKSSFIDFFTSINAVTPIGFGIINGIPTIEDVSFFYDENIEMLDLGEIKDFSLGIADNHIFNSIKVGYPDKDYEVQNGREEFNSVQIYKTPITRIAKELNLQSVYRADQFGIESVRLDFLALNLDNKDKEADNDTFFIFLEDSDIEPINPERQNAFLNIEGITDRSSVYNLRLSPKRNLLRHARYLHAFLTGLENYQITFESSTKNAELIVTDLDGSIVAEKANVSISNLQRELFFPYIATFTTDLNSQTKNAIESNPTGFIAFKFLGSDFKGFIIDVSFDASKNTQQEFKVLLCSNNNLLSLIH